MHYLNQIVAGFDDILTESLIYVILIPFEIPTFLLIQSRILIFS